MHPILFKFGPLTIYSYGVMVAIGFAVISILIYPRAARFGLNKDRVLDLLIVILIAGLVGARLFYILSNLHYYAANPLEIPNLSKGGLVWYGAFFSALGSALWYMRKHKLFFWDVMDLAAPYLALGQGIGRIGCYLNGCCYGIDGLPAQLYSSFVLIVIFVILRLWQDRRTFSGEIFLGYCILYSSKRFLMEFLRGDNPRIFYGFTLSQTISIVILVVSFGIFLNRLIKWKRNALSSK